MANVVMDYIAAKGTVAPTVEGRIVDDRGLEVVDFGRRRLVMENAVDPVPHPQPGGQHLQMEVAAPLVERVAPTRAQRFLRPALGRDALHLLVNGWLFPLALAKLHVDIQRWALDALRPALASQVPDPGPLARWPGWSQMLVALVVLAGFGFVTERLVLRPILGQPAFAIVMVTIGVGYTARGLITMIPGIGTDTHALAAPFKDQTLQMGGLIIGMEHVVIIATSVVLCSALFVLFRYTRVGIAMQAASQNQLAAYYMGIPVKRLNGLIWATSAAVAAVAGILLAPITFVHANMGFIGLKAFPAAVVGGFGSLPGAIVGGLIIGVVEALSGFFLPEGFKDIAAYVVVLAMLMVKPNGLFGEKLRKKV